MPLILYKRSYGASPWRIALEQDGVRRDLPDSGFARRRDAQPFYARLLAVGDWDRFATWEYALHLTAWRILDECPMRQQRGAVLAQQEGR